MSSFDIFDSRDPSQRRDHVRNLLAVAFETGPVTTADRDLLFRVGLRAGLGPMEVEGIFRRGRRLSFSMPANIRACIEQLYDAVLVLLLDGQLRPRELSLCRVTARRLGFPRPVVDSLIGQITSAIDAGQPPESTIDRLMKKIV